MDTKANRPVAEVAAASLFNRVVVDFNDLIEIMSHDLGHFVEFGEIVFSTIVVHEGWEGKRSEIAHSHFVRCGIFDDLGAKIGTANSSQVLLVALPVAGVFVEHVWVASLGLSLENGVPKLLSANCLATPTLLFISDHID